MQELDRILRNSDKQLLTRFKKRRPQRQDSGETVDLTVWERRLLGNRPSFQIHRDKMLDELVEYLFRNKLAWKPEVGYSDGPAYIEMNPKMR